MGHDKLRKFAENETFRCLVQPSHEELLRDGYDNLTDHPLKGHWKEFFGNSNPIVLELGCGKGEYTIELARRNPGINYIGVDIKGARLWKGAKFATQNSMGNVAFLRVRVEFISAFFAPGEVREIWLTFSDPQIRKENSRLSSPVFLERYRRFLPPDGMIHLKTDSRFLHEYTRSVCKANGLQVLFCNGDLYGSSTQDGIPSEVREVKTFYESIFLEQGYRITYICLRLGQGPALRSPSAEEFDPDFWRSSEGDRQLFGRDTAETRRQKLRRGDEKK